MKRFRGEKRNENIICYRISVSRRFMKSVYHTPFKVKNMFWYGEYADSDCFTPSCPHLHSMDGKYKLNVYTGDIYDVRTKQYISDKFVKEDELKKLWNEAKFMKFVNEMRRMYSEKYPNSVLPSIPSFI